MLNTQRAGGGAPAPRGGVRAAWPPRAMPIDNDNGTTSFSGDGASESFGNSTTVGDMSPQATLVQSSLNKLCVGLPAKVNAQSILAAVNVGVQDIPVLSAPQYQECAENSTQAKGDEPVSHVLDDLKVLSTNG
ncbi:rodlin [Streptomyces diastatochromogenes]|uniref:rodlin n=1 Tax=Streptomyces diastatochromogenes TaxID=42236 RepID=UPI00364BCD3D